MVNYVLYMLVFCYYLLKLISRCHFTDSYCFSKKAIADVRGSGRICILDIDMQGVKSIKQTDLQCRFIFVKPPSIRHLVILLL